MAGQLCMVALHRHYHCIKKTVSYYGRLDRVAGLDWHVSHAYHHDPHNSSHPLKIVLNQPPTPDLETHINSSTDMHSGSKLTLGHSCTPESVSLVQGSPQE